MRLSATAADLPPAVAAAVAMPGGGEHGGVVLATTWPTIAWGDPGDPPVLLIHGVTSNAGIWWRVGPAIAAARRRVIAIDMPGHGRSSGGPWSHRFADTAAEVARFIRTAGLDVEDLAVVGHSWGGMVTAHLPGVGIRPRTLVLLDPPVLTLERLRALTEQPTERTYDSLEDAVGVVRSENPTWSDGDVAAKALALTQFNAELVLDVLLKNGDWDGGMGALRAAAVTTGGRPDVWLIRGEWATGGFIPEFKVPAIEAQLGADRVVTIEGAPHSPQRTHPEATVLAILRALQVG